MSDANSGAGLDDFPEDLFGPAPGAPVGVPSMSEPAIPSSILPGGVEFGPVSEKQNPVGGTVGKPFHGGGETLPAVPGLSPMAPTNATTADRQRAILEACGGVVVGHVSTTPPITQGPAPTLQPRPAQHAPAPKPEILVGTKEHQRTKRNMDADFMPGQRLKDLMILRPVMRSNDLVMQTTLALFDKETMAYQRREGDAMIVHSRNYLADDFVKSEYEWALWWDDDMVPPIGNPAWTKKNVPGVPSNYPDQFLRLNPIDRLRSHGKKVIGGLYYGRRAPHMAVCQRTDLEALKKAPCAQIIPREWVGTGFLLTHRSVFLDMQKAYPELAPDPGAANPWERVWNYFKPDVMEAEDVSFCARAKKIGHQPYVDCSVVVFHQGVTCFGPWDQHKFKK